MSSKVVTLICGWAFAALVVAVMLLLGHDQTGGNIPVVYKTACACVSLAILVGTHLAAFSGGHPKRIATVVLWVALLLFTAVYSTFTMMSDEPRLVAYIAVNLLTFGAVSVLSFVLWSSATRGDASQRACFETKRAVLRSRIVADAMCHGAAGVKYAEQLRTLAENLRFQDDSATVEQDEQILDRLNDLSEHLAEEGYPVQERIDEIDDLVKQRNFAVKSLKSLH